VRGESTSSGNVHRQNGKLNQGDSTYDIAEALVHRAREVSKFARLAMLGTNGDAEVIDAGQPRFDVPVAARLFRLHNRLLKTHIYTRTHPPTPLPTHMWKRMKVHTPRTQQGE
jgi:hypothetical protein